MKNLTLEAVMPESGIVLRSLILALLLVISMQVSAAPRIFSLSADDWARPRSGAIIPQLESVKLAVDYRDAAANRSMKLLYPGEDSGEIWAAELRDWLISLGIPSDYIELSPGLQAQDEIRILVGTREELDRS